MTKHRTPAVGGQTVSGKQTKPRDHQNQPDNKKRRRWIKITLLSIVSLFVLSIGGGIGYAYYLIQDAPEFNPQAFSDLAATTNVYDRNGEWLGSMQSDGNRELIKSLQEVSPHVVNAFIAAEDKDFYKHHGISPSAILRAAYQNFIGGGIVSGASTITQQTVKNVMFPAQEQTIKRKVQEIYLALQLERVMTKDEILVQYLNWIYFGKAGPINVYGIKAAAKAFFGKDPKELNLAQAALLASLPNNPSKYNPYTSLDNARERQEYVLKEMLDTGKITQTDYEQARAFDIQSSLVQPQTTATRYGQYPYVISEVEQRAAEKLMTVAKYDSLDDARQALFKGGYKVYTTIDRRLQDAVDEVFQNDQNFYPRPISYTAKDGRQVKDAIQQAGATLLENQTGAILAIGGGRDYIRNQNNHTLLPRQPGSTMKPLAVYGPAADLKLLSPGSVLDDVPMQLSNGTGSYFPMNFDRKFHGLMTVREALVKSYNIPALKGMQLVKPSVGLDYVRKMGVTTLEPSDNEHLVSGIGGLAYGLTVEEATSAFSTFANGGVWKQSYLIARIVDRNGKVVYQQTPQETRVFSPQAAYVVTDMMQDIVRRGTASAVGAHFPNRLIAGKTGTTDGTTDSWFIGFTPRVTLGIWVGYDIPYPMANLNSRLDSGGGRSQLLWNQIMERVYAQMDADAGGFPPMPEGIVRREVCTKSGMIPSDLCRALGAVTTDLFIVGTEPKETCNKMVKVKYVEINGKKYLLNDQTAAFGGIAKEGIFIKRQPYPLPDGDPRYKPLDADLELPKEFDLDKQANRLPAPEGLQVTGTAPASVSLSWQTVSGADGYVIVRSPSPSGPYRIVSDVVTGTSFTDTSVQTGTIYYYQVAAVANGAVQPVSNPVQAVPRGEQTALPAPSGLIATHGPVGVSLSWQPVPGASEYILYRSGDGSTFEELMTVKGTRYQDITSPKGNVWYKVAAKNGSVISPPSAAVKASVGSSPPSAEPTLSAKNG